MTHLQPNITLQDGKIEWSECWGRETSILLMLVEYFQREKAISLLIIEFGNGFSL